MIKTVLEDYRTYKPPTGEAGPHTKVGDVMEYVVVQSDADNKWRQTEFRVRVKVTGVPKPSLAWSSGGLPNAQCFQVAWLETPPRGVVFTAPDKFDSGGNFVARGESRYARVGDTFVVGWSKLCHPLKRDRKDSPDVELGIE